MEDLADAPSFLFLAGRLLGLTAIGAVSTGLRTLFFLGSSESSAKVSVATGASATCAVSCCDRILVINYFLGSFV
jgi:hypothetical protein